MRESAAIFVGDVSSAKLVKTRLAKNTLDAGWSMFKTMLEHKGHRSGRGVVKKQQPSQPKSIGPALGHGVIGRGRQ